MNREFESLSRQIQNARCPEDVFGVIDARDETMLPILKQRYRAYAKIVHPDVYQEMDIGMAAQSTFRLLTTWLARAEQRIKAGKYGEMNLETTTLRTAKREYQVEDAYVEGEIYNIYSCHFLENGRLHHADLKVVRDPIDNPLADREMRALRILGRQTDSRKISPYIPQLLDAFVYDNGSGTRQALVMQKYPGWYSLEDVRAAYPDGVHPKDMAWVWRRLLVVLGYAHRRGILHGAVLPHNVWILPEEHGLMLSDWTSALIDPDSVGTSIPVVHQKYQEWYPQDVLRKAGELYPADILMSAKCMLWLLGGGPHKKIFPNSIPDALKAFLSGCILPLNRSPWDAWKLLEEFDELLETLWGPRKFHPFRIQKFH